MSDLPLDEQTLSAETDRAISDLQDDAIRESEEIERLTDEIEQLQRNWQPIETAPKDGTEILAWRDDCGCMLVRWACADEFLTESEIESGDWSEENLSAEDWFYADFIAGGRLEGAEVPTHWMPLPTKDSDTPGDSL